jgi:hypothetical protein
MIVVAAPEPGFDVNLAARDLQFHPRSAVRLPQYCRGEMQPLVPCVVEDETAEPYSGSREKNRTV